MSSDPRYGRDRENDPAFSEEGMRRIVYGSDRDDDEWEGREQVGLGDGRSQAFAEDTAELASHLRGRRNLVPIVTALAPVVCFVAILWYAYRRGIGQMASDQLPVVVAEPLTEKTKPENPGGLEGRLSRQRRGEAK